MVDICTTICYNSSATKDYYGGFRKWKFQ